MVHHHPQQIVQGADSIGKGSVAILVNKNNGMDHHIIGSVPTHIRE